MEGQKLKKGYQTQRDTRQNLPFERPRQARVCQSHVRTSERYITQSHLSGVYAITTRRRGIDPARRLQI